MHNLNHFMTELLEDTPQDVLQTPTSTPNISLPAVTPTTPIRTSHATTSTSTSSRTPTAVMTPLPSVVTSEDTAGLLGGVNFLCGDINDASTTVCI